MSCRPEGVEKSLAQTEMSLTGSQRVTEEGRSGSPSSLSPAEISWDGVIPDKSVSSTMDHALIH